MTERLRIDVPDLARVESVSALWDPPTRPGQDVTVLLAHGAGADMESAFMERVAAELAGRGLAVLRFDYAYQERARREGRRRPPDRTAVLEEVHRRALAEAERRAAGGRLVLAGKSLGGRMASHLAAQGAPAAGLVFLGYPLHPPGKPERLRSEHFAAIPHPALFLSGTRDNLCRLPLLRTELERWGGPARLVEIEGGNHGFEVPKKYGGDGGPPYGRLGEAIDAWLRDSI